MNNRVMLTNLFAKVNIMLTDIQIDQLLIFYKMLIERNDKVNLTAITDFEEVVLKHFIDSLSLTYLKDLHFEQGHKTYSRVIDVGTGGGFPGIPLKIIFPEIELTLLDSLNKRVTFLNEVIEQLKLSNTIAIHERAEILGRDEEYRERYDLCVSRAVAKLSSLSELCLPFVKPRGYFVAYKGNSVDEEVIASYSAISLLNGKVIQTELFQLPGTDINRSLVLIEKIGKIDEKYPRKAGIPLKRPL